MAVAAMKVIGHGSFQLLFSNEALREYNIGTINAGNK